MIIFTFLAILFGVVITKLTILIAAANVREHMSVNCIKYNRTHSGKITHHYTQCINPAINYTVTYQEECLGRIESMDSEYARGEYQICKTLSIRWIWCLTLMVITPEVFVFIRCLWTILFKKEKSPKKGTIFIVSKIQLFEKKIFIFR